MCHFHELFTFMMIFFLTPTFFIPEVSYLKLEPEFRVNLSNIKALQAVLCVRQQGMLGIVLYVLYPCIVSYCIIIIVTAGAFVCEDDRWGGLLIVEGGE